MKKLLKVMGILFLAVLLVVAGYFAYLFLAYHRLGSVPLTVEGEEPRQGPALKEAKILSWNIGFGAYEADYGFFMDGGSQSWAWSRERLGQNMENIGALLAGEQAQIYLLQEVDTDSTRAYHLDERRVLSSWLGACPQSVFAQNADSPFLMYPFHQPHGRIRSGLYTLSAYPIQSALRIELPIEDGLSRFFDLDRCYSKHLLSLPGKGRLSLYNLHCSAYTSDDSIALKQIQLLLEDMEKEYEAGAYCIAGGDFNKNLLGDSSQYFHTSDAGYSWTKPLPEHLLKDYHLSLAAPLYGADGTTPVPSARNADGPYHEGQLVVTVDGFLVSDNLQVEALQVIDTGFAYSDHNPVKMTVRFLQEEK